MSCSGLPAMCLAWGPVLAAPASQFVSPFAFALCRFILTPDAPASSRWRDSWRERAPPSRPARPPALLLPWQLFPHASCLQPGLHIGLCSFPSLLKGCVASKRLAAPLGAPVADGTAPPGPPSHSTVVWETIPDRSFQPGGEQTIKAVWDQAGFEAGPVAPGTGGSSQVICLARQRPPSRTHPPICMQASQAAAPISPP